jgi:ABC-type metal ion transport system substrate-binding protein
VAAAQKQRHTLKNPPIDADRYLEILQKQGLIRTVKNLAGFRTVL